MHTLEFVREEDEGRIAYWRFKDDGTKIKKPPRETRREIHSLVISDTHFGSTTCKAAALLATLNTFWITHNLVLNGDIFNGSDLGYVSRAQERVTRRIRKLGYPESDTHVRDIWILGNHDEHVVDVFRRWFGLEVHREFVWECGNKKYLGIHGHQWDHFVSNRPGLTSIVIWLHGLVQRLDPQNKHVVRFFAHRFGHWRQEHERVAAGAAAYGRTKGVDYVMCGHTHKAMRQKFDGVEYLNSGCWTQDPCSFITITEAGPVLNFVQLS